MINEVVYFSKITGKYYVRIGNSPYKIPATLAKRIINDQNLVESIDKDYINYIKKP
jgi:hypothetical protein